MPNDWWKTYKLEHGNELPPCGILVLPRNKTTLFLQLRATRNEQNKILFLNYYGKKN